MMSLQKTLQARRAASPLDSEWMRVYALAWTAARLGQYQ